MEVLNMLNTKYFISPQKQLQLNNQANGVAWFIKNIQEVNTPMEEIKALDSLKTKESAVVLSSEFEKSDYDGIGDGNGNIELISYKPLQLEYTVNTTTNQFAVFLY